MQKRCQWCLRRDREDGGNGTCPLEKYLKAEYYAARSHDCRAFKLGDLRERPLPVGQEGLF